MRRKYSGGAELLPYREPALFTHAARRSPSAVGTLLAGRRNAAKLLLRRNEIVSRRIPKAFDGFRILHLSDLHTDMSQQAMARLLDLLPSLEYELCVLTGDYRGKTSGPFNLSLAEMARLREALKGADVTGLGGGTGTKFPNEQLRSMIGIVLVTHGRLAAEFRAALEHVAGPQKPMSRSPSVRMTISNSGARISFPPSARSMDLCLSKFSL